MRRGPRAIPEDVSDDEPVMAQDEQEQDGGQVTQEEVHVTQDDEQVTQEEVHVTQDDGQLTQEDVNATQNVAQCSNKRMNMIHQLSFR